MYARWVCPCARSAPEVLRCQGLTLQHADKIAAYERAHGIAG